MSAERVAAAVGLFSAEERERLVTLRRALHAEPELSWQERATQAKLRAALVAAGIADVQEIAGTGLLARIPGRTRGAPTVAIRGDIDALPITEETGLPFASRTPGLMHACGHDMHATWTVAAGLLLAKRRAAGEVRLLLQPAEEVGEGARKCIEAGALAGVSAIFGGHVDWRVGVGEVVATAGPLAASTDSFEITFTGRGGHGARPQDTLDPIVGLAAFVMEAQTIVSRALDPTLPGVVSVGVVSAGEASNVIPERARCAGTIRATVPAVRALLTSEVRRIAEAVAAVHRLKADVVITDGTPPLVNSATGSGWAQSAVRALLGDGALKALATTNMGGEDFAHYLERTDGCFMRIGTWSEGRSRAGVHTPRFDPDETAIMVGGAILAECARQASG